MTELYPLIMEPYFRSGLSTPWGGHALRDRYGKNTPEEVTGESLEISALPGHESRVVNGVYRGKQLHEILALWGDRLTGRREDSFPLMLKLLDAQQCLSVQVHPDDSYASEHEGKLGKSEAWYILDAVPGARLVYGVDTQGESLRAVVEEGRLEQCLHWVEVHPGDVFYIPSGTIHALGPGIQCYEIQEASDVTYRFWDWDRIGKDGKPRKLHTGQALAVSNPYHMPEKAKQEVTACTGGTASLLVDDPHFQLYAIDLDGTYSLTCGEMQFVTAMEPCAIRWDDREERLSPFQSALIPAKIKAAELSGTGRVLVSRAGQRT